MTEAKGWDSTVVIEVPEGRRYDGKSALVGVVHSGFNFMKAFASKRVCAVPRVGLCEINR